MLDNVDSLLPLFHDILANNYYIWILEEVFNYISVNSKSDKTKNVLVHLVYNADD